MSDAREALVALLWEKFGAWPNGPLAAWLTKADCARFADVILAAGWTPPGERVKPTVEAGVCYHQNANYLAMMSERDALRAEVERLREVSAAQPYETERELAVALDEARQQVADLRAGIEALRDRAARLGLDEAAEDANTLLAGSGEQPGERDATPDEAHDIGYSKGHADGYREAMAERRPAPMVPDSTDVRYLADRIETAMTDGGHRMPRTDETRYLAHVAAQTALAVVGQGVAVEWGVGYGDRHEAAPSREDAEGWIADDDAWNPGEERWLVTRQVGPWTRVAVRPSEKEADDDR